MNTRRAVILATLLLSLLLTAVTVVAQGSGYNLSWFTVDGGGGTSQSSDGPQAYTLSGTVGQPDAGTMGGGGYELSGGYWGGTGAAQLALYLPLVVR